MSTITLIVPAYNEGSFIDRIDSVRTNPHYKEVRQ